MEKCDPICHGHKRKQKAYSKNLTKIILVNVPFSEVWTGLRKQQGVKGTNT